MILQKEKLNQLLSIFSESKSLNLYDNSKEKNEMEKTSLFLSNFFMRNTPENNWQNSLSPKIDIIEMPKKSNISLYKSRSMDNLFFNNPNVSEMKQSIINLKKSQKMYKNEEESYRKKNNSKLLNSSILRNNYLCKNSNIYSSHKNIFMNPLEANNSFTNYSNYNEINNNQKHTRFKSQYQINYKSPLKEIPSNPDDVIIKDFPLNPWRNKKNNNISSQTQNINFNQRNYITSYYKFPQQIKEEINMIDYNNNIEIQNNNQIENNGKYIVKEIPKGNKILKSIKYHITQFNGPIELPEGYSTDDIDEFNAIQAINDNLSNWKLNIDKPNYKIYSKPYKTLNEKGKEKESRMFYLDASIERPSSEINKQINSFELRKNWEDSFQKGKLLKEEDLGDGKKIMDYYGYIKMPLIFSDREIIVQRKIWNNYNDVKDCCLTEGHSIEYPDFPIKKKPIRANVICRCKYIKPINNNKTKFYYVNKTDLKLSINDSILENHGAEKMENWLKDFLKQLGI